MNRIIKIILRAIGLITLLFSGYVIGILEEQNHQKRLEDLKEDVSTIAVVNMDEGVSLGEGHINYASQLMNLPNERFVVTGLNDAKVGINNGYYAAYIVIPETFSASVTSIENDPRKVILEYQYNSRLDEDAQLQAVSDVNLFINLMNSNIAYMYVDAILGEFHHIQDDSAAILASDNAELELLKKVDATQLIAATESIEEATVDFDIQPVELSSYTNQNNDLLESLQFGYLEAAQKGKEEYAIIHEGNAEVENASNQFFSTYNEIIAGMTNEWSELLEVGQNNLRTAVGLHNQNVEDKRQEVEDAISDMMAEQLAINQEYTSTQLEKIFENINGDKNLQIENVQKDLATQLAACQEAVDEPLENLSNAAYIQGYVYAFEILEAEIASRKDCESATDITIAEIEAIIDECKTADIQPEMDDYSVYVSEVKKLLNEISIHWDSDDMLQTVASAEEAEAAAREKYAIVLPACDTETIISRTKELMGFFELQAETDEINSIIQENFVDALLNANQTQIGPLYDALDVLNQEMENYQNSLEQYDPLKYIEDAGLTVYLSNINGNARDMLDAIGQNNQEYITYSTEMYQATNENMSRLRNAVNLSNKQTSLNVENCINELIASRENINSQNVNMLAAFTDSLRYTRVDSQTNTEVYDYIVNPIVSQRKGQITVSAPQESSTQRNDGQELIILLLGAGIVACIVEIIRSYLRQYRKHYEESGNVY